MKRIVLTIAILVMFAIYAFPGGIMTNINQSASYSRMLAREGVLDIDGVFYNPAGVSLLGGGLHISLNNQFIFQTRTIKTDYPYLNNNEYQGDLKVLFFPGIYAAYNLGKFSLSFGFNPIGGGGSATYNNGLPSYEYSISDLVPALNSGNPTLNIANYSMDINFEGSSVFLGYQLNFGYKINDFLSVAVGARYISAKETYSGTLNNIILGLYGGAIPRTATYVFENARDQYYAAANSWDTINPLVANALRDTAQMMDSRAEVLSGQSIDVERNGYGIAPIISLNLNLLKNLNVSVKYEFNTKIVLENNTSSDFYTQYYPDTISVFPDGEKKRSDMPALLTIGASYSLLDKLMVSGSYRNYFETLANWDGLEDSLDGNTYEIAIGLEYKLMKLIRVSVGYQYGHVPENSAFNSDMKFHVPSNTIGFGFGIKPLPFVEINLGASYAKYTAASHTYSRHIADNLSYPVMSITETYNKDTWLFGVGLDFTLGKNKD